MTKHFRILLLTCLTLFGVINQPTIGQESSTQMNDTRASIGTIDPKLPIQIRIVSQTKVPIVTNLLQPPSSDRALLPGKSLIFGRLHTQYLPLPINLQVSIQEQTGPNNPLSLFLEVKTAKNEIILNVTTSLTRGGNPSQSVNIDEKGKIFLY